MSFNNDISDLIKLAIEENKFVFSYNFDNSDEYKEIYNRVDDKSRIIDCIEEELGCPIEVLHEALKNGIYSILRGTDKIFDNTVITDGKYLYAIPLDIYDEQWLIKDYKKTWWLRKDKSE